MRTWFTIFCVTASTTVAQAQQDPLQSCRQLLDSKERLACYDKLADAYLVRAQPQKTADSPSSSAAPQSVAPAQRTAADNFGLPPAARKEEAQSVQSSVGADFSGWSPNQRIRLANGQVWQVTDGTSVALPAGPRKVTVKRGALGSFYLDFEGLNTSPRVRRVE